MRWFSGIGLWYESRVDAPKHQEKMVSLQQGGISESGTEIRSYLVNWENDGRIKACFENWYGEWIL